MYIDIFECPGCHRPVSPHSRRCDHCRQTFDAPRHTSVFRWHWLDRFFLLSIALIIACFFMPWMPGGFLYQDAPFSAYGMLSHLVDLDIDFLESYNILRMALMLPLFSILLFFLIFLSDQMKQSPFPGIFHFILLQTGVSLQFYRFFSGMTAHGASVLFLVALAMYYRRNYIRGTIGKTVHSQLTIFLSLSMVMYVADLYTAFYARLEQIHILETWGFMVIVFFCFAMALLLLLRHINKAGDFWSVLFILFFSVIAYTALVKPLFFTGTLLFFADNLHDVTRELGAHIQIVGIALAIAIVMGVPVGVYITRNPGLAGIVLYISSILITIPSIAMFGFMMPILSSLDNVWDSVNGIGIGVVPAVVALSLYSLLPIVRNTYIALKSVDPATMEAGRGMGMTGFQLLVKLQLPLAAPIIMAGVRTAVVMGIAIAAIAAYIGAGGLGVFVSEGLQMSTNSSVIAGAVLMSLLAIVADIFLGRAEEWLTPDGLKIEVAPK